jgi:hypothetical protein
MTEFQNIIPKLISIFSFLGPQVFEFLTIISPCMTDKNIFLNIYFCSKKLDEKQRVSVNKFLDIVPKLFSQINLSITCTFTVIQSLPDIDNKMGAIALCLKEDSDIPILMTMLATPRQDGQQRVVFLRFQGNMAPQNMLDAIKNVEQIFFC